MFRGIRLGFAFTSLDSATRSEVLPRFGPAVLVGLVLGVGLSEVARYYGMNLTWPRLLLGTLGGFFGALIGMMMAVAQRAQIGAAAPIAGASILWDPWLDERDGAEEPPPPLETCGARAAVRPRILLPETGEAYPLEDELLSLVKNGEHGIVRITGPQGAGKTTAINHLRAILPPLAQVQLLDDPQESEIQAAAGAGLLVYASERARWPKHLATYPLAPWGRDERMEYLLATARDQCGSVMERLRTTEHQVPDGNPELWTMVLDRMSADAEIRDPRHALRRALAEQFSAGPERAVVGAYCLAAIAAPGDLGQPGHLATRVTISNMRWLRHRAVRLLLASERIVDEVCFSENCRYLGIQLPRDLVQEAGDLIAADDLASRRLRERLAREDRSHDAMAASLLHAARVGWRPEAGRPLRLSGAYLDRAAWSDVDLSQIEMMRVDLSAAMLHRCKLNRADLRNANLRGAFLIEALLNDARLCSSDLSHADLGRCVAHRMRCDDGKLEGAHFEGASLHKAAFPRANLVGACFRNASLIGAEFDGANIDAADFTGADLSKASLRGVALHQAQFDGAVFQHANLNRANLEEMHLPNACFQRALLFRALLTGSRMPSASFDGASLAEAGLAEVEWENVCLRDADLSGATFHLGTSRSGLVGSPIACEGSRTGFYTDDFYDRDFKAPEEIRKANLRGADLRGAKIRGVDFYLVDLRDALYDAEQAEHLRRCGAILNHRV